MAEPLIEHEYTINGSPTTITRRRGNEVVGVDTVLYHAGFQRHRQFELYPEDAPNGDPLEEVDLDVEDAFIAVPRDYDTPDDWRR